ncbi:hypothetical protein D9O50_13920 [Oxalobacteraceae bacterium CAVE-383]|nr:hypothetical protein D9O50_13920 [Oxalobacteraceae bacterium CAVE-383]
MTEHAQRKQQLIMRGAVCRAQLLNAVQAVRHSADIKVLTGQAKAAAFGMLKRRLHLQQVNVLTKVEKILPVVVDGVLTASSASTRAIRKPVLYGAMILGAASALPRFFKGRKSNDKK